MSSIDSPNDEMFLNSINVISCKKERRGTVYVLDFTTSYGREVYAYADEATRNAAYTAIKAIINTP